MPFIPVPEAASVVVHQTLFGVPVNNVLGFARSGGWDATSLGDLADQVGTHWFNNFLPNLSSDLTLDSVTARDLSVADGVQAVNAVDPPLPGLVAAPSMSGNVAFVITHRTAFIGRSRRGRSYIAGLAETHVTANLFATAQADALAAAFNTMRTSLAALGYFFCVISRYTGGAPRTTGITTAVSVSETRDYRVDTQRGRLTA